MAQTNLGLNNNLMREVVQFSRGNLNRQSSSDLETKNEYDKYKGKASPLLQKLLIPSIASSIIAEPLYHNRITSGIKKFSPLYADKFSSLIESASGPIGGLGYLIPKALSEGLRSRRHAYEKRHMPQLGKVGRASNLLDQFSTLNYLTSGLPKGLGMLASTMFPNIKTHLPKIPRLENWLTGTAKERLTGIASEGAPGGLLNLAYSGAKGTVNKLTGNAIPNLLKNAAEQGGIAGTLAHGAGAANSKIMGVLADPTGLSLALSGLQIGMSIWKSIKLARLQPRREVPESFARKYLGPDTSGPAMRRILAMTSKKGMDAQTLSFMVLQVIEGDIRRSNVLLAGLRGEIASESDFIRQEREKGQDAFFDTYGREIFGEDNRGFFSTVFDKLDYTLSSLKEKYDPITQIMNKLLGHSNITDKLAKTYGYDTESEMTKEKSITFGVAGDQTKLLHTPASAICSMAPNVEASKMAIMSASFDINRFILAELMTIRISGFGIQENILNRREPSFLEKMFGNILEKIDPRNWPGINALLNIAKLPVDALAATFRGARGLVTSGMSGLEKVSAGARRMFVGKHYQALKDPEALIQEAGLSKEDSTKINEFFVNGLPAVLSDIRWVEYEELNVQKEILDIQHQAFELMGGMYEKRQASVKNVKLVWDEVEGRYLEIDNAEKLKRSRQMKMMSIKEEAFSESVYGRLTFLGNLLSVIVKPDKSSTRRKGETQEAYDARLAQYSKKGKIYEFLENRSHHITGTVGYEAGVERMTAAEQRAGKAEEVLTGGQRRTFLSKDITDAISTSLTSLKTQTGVEATTKEIEDLQRLYEFKPLEQVALKTGIPIAVLVALAGGLIPASVVAGVGTLGYGAAKLHQRSKISKIATKSIGYRTPEEEMIERWRDTLGKPLQVIADQYEKLPLKDDYLDRDTFGISQNEIIQSNQAKFGIYSEMLNELKTIKSYLGKDLQDNIYTLLAPGEGGIAEVQLADATADDYKPDSSSVAYDTAQIYHPNIYSMIGRKLRQKGEKIDTDKEGKIIDTEEAVACADGGIIPAGKAALVGEKEAEILLPVREHRKVESVSDFYSAFELICDEFHKVVESFDDLSKASINERTNLIDGIQNQPMSIEKKLEEIAKESKDDVQKEWQGNVIEELQNISENINKPTTDKLVEDKPGFFSNIFGFLKDNLGSLGTIAGVAGIGALAYQLLSGVASSILDMILSDEQQQNLKDGFYSILGEVAKYVLDSPALSAVAGVASGAGIGYLFGGIRGLFAGSIIGASVGLIGSTLYDWFTAESAGDFADKFSKSLTGGEPGEILGLAEIGTNAAKWAIMGAGIGMMSGNPVNMMAGALIGGALGGAFSLIQNISLLAFEGISNIPSFIQTCDGEILNLFRNVHPFAATTAKAGSVFPIVGTFVGGLFGSVIGGILNVFGNILSKFDIGQKLKDKVKAEFPKLYSFFFEENTKTNTVFGKTGAEVLERDFQTAYEKADYESAENAINKYYTSRGESRPTTGKYSSNVVAKMFKKEKARLAISGGKVPGTTTTPDVQHSTPNYVEKHADVNDNDILSRIMKYESFSPVPYLDPPGNNDGQYSIGFGHLIKQNERNLLNATIDEPTAAKILADDYTQTKNIMLSRYPEIQNLDSARQAAVLDMGYNLGPYFLDKWTGLRQALNEQDFNKAGESVVASKYYNQVGYRAKDNIHILKTGLMPAQSSSASQKSSVITSVSNFLSKSANSAKNYVKSGEAKRDAIDVFGIFKELAVGIKDSAEKHFFSGISGPVMATGQRNEADVQKVVELQKSIKDSEEEVKRQESIAQTEQMKEIKKERLKKQAETKTSIPVVRGSTGTEITSTFTDLEKRIFGSLSRDLINNTINYPFESKMIHSVL